MLNIIIGAIIGIVIIVVALILQAKHQKLVQNGVKAEGIIFEYEEDFNNTGTGTYKFPVIRFLTKDNEWITEKFKLGFSFKPFKVGTPVEVYYNSADPTDFTIKPSQMNFVFIIMVVVGLIFISISVFQYITTNSL